MLQGFKSPFVAPFEKRDQAKAAKMRFATEKSDLLTTVKMFNAWLDVRRNGKSAERRFCEENFVSMTTLWQVSIRSNYALR